MGDRIAHFHLARGLDAGNYIAYIAGREFLAGLHVEFEHPDLICIILLAGSHEFHEIVLPDRAVDNLEIGNDTAEGIEYGVENQSLQRSLRIALGGGHSLYDGTQNVRHAYTGLAAGADHFRWIAAEQVYNLIFHLIGFRTVEVHFVDDRNYLQIIVNRHVEIRYGLGLDAL